MHKSISSFWRVAALVVLMLVAISSYVLLSPFTGKDSSYFYVTPSDSPQAVVQRVTDKTGILQAMLFRLLATTMHYDQHIIPGRYELGKGLSTFEVFRRLRNGRQAPVRFTVPIVRTSRDLSRLLGKHFHPSAQQFEQILSDTNRLANYGETPATVLCLFIPNTYEINWSTSPEEFLDRMNREREKFWTEGRKSKARTIALSTNQVITLASIVEQETAYNPEKPRVAGLYLNRLRKGMPLQADPTVKYALQDFSLRRIRHQHLAIDSPYNTYRHRGLPPGPICIPSLASIEGVLNAETHDYFYMCAKEDFSGSHNFATTYEEHLKNAQLYVRALDQRAIQ